MSVTIIKPKKSVFKATQQEKVIQNTLTAQAKAIKVDHDVTTQTWKHRPKFTVEQTAQYERTISTGDEVYAMLNKGTKAHDIRPKKPRGWLRFKTPFSAKTVPNQIMSRAGSIGSNVVEVMPPGTAVHHPGTKPRNWNKVIKKKWDAQVGSIFQRALDAETR